MSENHSIRNGVIAGVASGVILAVLFSVWVRELLYAIATSLWNLVTDLFVALTKTVEMPIWLLVVLVMLTIPTILWVVRSARRREEEPEAAYTEDRMFGVVWRWANSHMGIVNLMPYCPKCDIELVYSEQRNDGRPVQPGYFPPDFTEFVCERCKVRSERLAGAECRAVARVEREIRRRIRTGEWKKHTEEGTDEL